MMPETLTGFLRKRDQDPEDFKVAIKKHQDKMVSRGGCFDTTWVYSIRDIKRFGDVVVVLEGVSYLSGWPGIRRSTVTTVFTNDNDALYRAENVHIDGGYKTQRLDRPDEDFREISGVVVRENEMAVVLVTDKQQHRYVIARKTEEDSVSNHKPVLGYKEHHFRYGKWPSWEALVANHSNKGLIDLNWWVSIQKSDPTVRVYYLYGSYGGHRSIKEARLFPEQVKQYLTELKKEFKLGKGITLLIESH